MGHDFTVIYHFSDQPSCPLLVSTRGSRSDHTTGSVFVREPLWYTMCPMGLNSINLFVSVLHRFFSDEVVPIVQKDVNFSRGGAIRSVFIVHSREMCGQ
jgi:hypothetical protein